MLTFISVNARWSEPSSTSVLVQRWPQTSCKKISEFSLASLSYLCPFRDLIYPGFCHGCHILIAASIVNEAFNKRGYLELALRIWGSWLQVTVLCIPRWCKVYLTQNFIEEIKQDLLWTTNSTCGMRTISSQLYQLMFKCCICTVSFK